MTHASNIPRHLYVFVDRRIISGGKESGWEPAVWFGLSSVPHRAWALTVMLKCGAVYRGLPLSAIATNTSPDPWELADAQRWDCFGWEFSVLIYDYLRELSCSVWIASKQIWVQGSYLFTAEPYGDGYSLEPSQTKSHHFIELSNGRVTCVPSNNVIFREASFISGDSKPNWLRVQTEVYHAEEQPFDKVVTEETA